MRAESNQKIEALRAEARLGSSLQAEVTVEAPAPTTRSARHARRRPALRPDHLGGARATAAAAADADVLVEAAVSAAPKCERCWHYRADVGADPAHPTICGRCTANLFGAGEPRRVRLMARRRRSRRRAPWLGIALAVIVLDQITKAMIVAGFQLGDARR